MNDFVHPRVYFSRGFFDGDKIKNELLNKFALSSANVMLKDRISIAILNNCYQDLFNTYEQFRDNNDVENLTDIMRASIFVEPYIHYPFLIELIDEGLISASTDADINAFFVHLNTVIHFCKQGKQNSNYIDY